MILKMGDVALSPWGLACVAGLTVTLLLICAIIVFAELWYPPLPGGYDEESLAADDGSVGG